MEKTKGRMTLRIIISILVAIAVWLYVDIGQATNVSTNVRDVPVEFSGENSVLADRGLMIVSGYDTTINLRIEGPRRELWKLDKEAIRIVADTSNITETGVQTLKYEVIFPDNVSRSDLTVKASAYTVTVTVGELYTKEIPVRCEVVGELAEGFHAEEVQLDPSQLVLRGQRDDLLNVSYAKIQLDVSGATKTVVQGIAYTLYDYNDVPVENENIRAATKMIQATLPVYTTKTVPLVINFVSAPGSTEETMECTLAPQKSVTISGEKEILDTIDSIVLGEIYLQDLSGSQTVVYDIPVPEGTVLVDDITQVTATIVVTGVTERTLAVTAFQFAGVPEGYTVTPVTESLNIVMRGLTKEIEALKAENISVTVDLAGVEEPGNYTLPVTVEVTGYNNVSAKGSYQIIVNLAPAETVEPDNPGGADNADNTGNTNNG